MSEPVDQALDRLRGPTTVDQRLDVLQQLVEYWHGPIRPDDGIPESELASIRLPRPLHWWYRWAGRRKEIMSGQNWLLDPEKLHMKDGRLLFYRENQSVYLWATLQEGEDPPVFGRYRGEEDEWEPEGVTLSEHLILSCILEAVMCHALYHASAACLDRGTLTK